MTTQLNPLNYAEAIQAQLSAVVDVPVYALFNRNYATEPKFLTWQLRNVHQPVYTGTTQSNKGIDRPIYQTSVFAKTLADALSLTNTILQSLHGYSGQFGGSGGFYVAKVDVDMLFHTYDNDLGLHQVVLDTTLDIPA